MNIYFTADTHFHHKNIIHLQDRPYKDLDHMTEDLIDRWNSVVKYEDTIYHLGDFSFAGPQGWDRVLRRLNGKKHLIIGNHDKKVEKSIRHFMSIQHYLELEIDDRKICLSHYPMLAWNRSHRGSWHLHGHCHANLKHDAHARRLDVGVDNPLCDFTPISYEQVKEYMDTILPFIPVDHHGG